MDAFAAIMIWLLPGSFFCLHQGIDHIRGKHVPQLVVFDWDVPHWLLYLLVLLLGPVLMLAFFIDVIRRS